MRLRVNQRRRNPKFPNNLTTQANNLVAQRMEFERRAVELKAAGHSSFEIADKLGLRHEEISPLLLSGFAEYRADRNNSIDRYAAVIIARYERMLREWWPRALTSTEHIDNGDGTTTELTHPADPVATKIVLKIQSEMSKMLGLNKIKVEHTGKDGASIAATIDITQIPSDLVERFLKTGDQSILAPGFVHALPTRGQGSNGDGAEAPRTRKE